MNMAARVFCGSAGIAGSLNLWMRFKDRVESSDSFSKHCNEQQKRHWISGMHNSYIPNASQKELIAQYFSQFQHLIPSSQEAIDKQNSLKSPIHIRRLAECPPIDDSKLNPGGTVVVGGPPALISTVFETAVTYINDGRRAPIASGSAFHLEWDAVSEAPTSSQPIHFMIDQVKRVFFPESLAIAKQTGYYSWKSLDWVSWMHNPSKWLIGIRIAAAFQQFTQSGPHLEVTQEVISRTKRNEDFYKRLNEKLNHQLLMPGAGSVYVARNAEEQDALIGMQKDLTGEQRAFPFLSEEQIKQEFGYLPQGVAFAKKIHDRTLSPHFLPLLCDNIVREGGRVIDARVTAVYTDDPDLGGIVAYQTSDNQTHYVRFTKLVMSLGTQQVIGDDGAPLFDIVSARGVSAIALARLPEGAALPPAIVCGETNHVTKLAGPIQLQGENLFLLRMTCGACIAPTSDSTDYDGGAAIGLQTAVSNVLNGKIEILTAYGCNRQVSQYGQTHWLQVPKTLKADAHGFTPRGSNEDVGSSLPKKPTGIFVQYGAGGGGLTQGPSQ